MSALLILGGCSPAQTGNSAPAAVNCGPADQSATFMTPVEKNATLQVTIDSRFSSDQVNSILAAIDVWNQYGRSTLGRVLFNASNGSVNEAESPQKAGDCSFTGDPSAFPIIMETSATKWTALNLSKFNPAVTIRCSGGATLASQTMLIYPSYTQKEEFMSVVLHELGHALGLDHSCTSATAQTGFPACASLSDSHPYNQAVMNPVLHPNLGNANLTEKKENLRSNDTERATCRLN